MSYTHEVIRYARELDEHLCVDRNEELNLYTVFINKVVCKEGYANRNIKGSGFTIEDASYDFIRLARGRKLYHFISDKEVDVL